MNFTNDPKFICGKDEETGVHVAAECQRYRAPGYAYFGKTKLTVIGNKTLNVMHLADFLERTKRLEWIGIIGNFKNSISSLSRSNSWTSLKGLAQINKDTRNDAPTINIQCASRCLLPNLIQKSSVEKLHSGPWNTSKHPLGKKSFYVYNWIIYCNWEYTHMYNRH